MKEIFTKWLYLALSTQGIGLQIAILFMSAFHNDPVVN